MSDQIKIHDCEIEDYVLRKDVKTAVNKLKERYPNFVPAIDKSFGKLV